MAASGKVVGQQHIAGAEDALGAVAQADLYLPFQGDHVLAARGHVPVDEIAGLIAAEVDVLRVLNRSPFGLAYLLVW